MALDGVLAQQLLGVADEVVQRLQGREDLDEVRLRRRLALLARDEGGDLFRLLEDEIVDAEQDLSPLAEGALAPGRKRVAGRGTASRACSASRRVASAKGRPVAGLTAARRPARPSTSRLAIQEWARSRRPIGEGGRGRLRDGHGRDSNSALPRRPRREERPLE